MNRIQQFPYAVWMALLAIAAAAAVANDAGVERLSPEAIIGLARDGRSREAIHAFEALPEHARDSLHLRRAVADSYWREREFESANALYNEILKLCPTLQGLLPDDQPAVPALVAIPAALDEPAVESDANKADAGVAATLATAGAPGREGVSPAASVADTASVDEAARLDEKVDVPSEVPSPLADAAAEDSVAGVDAILEQLRRECLKIQSRARQCETLLQDRLRAQRMEMKTAMEALEARHQAREQALMAQVSSLEQMVDALRAELDKARESLQKQVEQSPDSQQEK